MFESCIHFTRDLPCAILHKELRKKSRFTTLSQGEAVSKTNPKCTVNEKKKKKGLVPEKGREKQRLKDTKKTGGDKSDNDVTRGQEAAG